MGRAAARSSCVVKVARCRRSGPLASSCSTAASRPDNGHPEETLTRHHPISMPSMPKRGRECQAPQPGSPTSRRETRTHLSSAGSASIRRSSSRLRVSTCVRSSSVERASPIRVGEVVAHTLQLAEAEHPRLGGGGEDLAADLDSPECLAEETRQLTLEPADLAPQLGAREALVAPGAKPSESVSFEQSRHKIASEFRSHRRRHKQGSVKTPPASPPPSRAPRRRRSAARP